MTAARIREYAERDRAALIALWQDCALLRPWNDPKRDIARCLATPASALLVADGTAPGALAASIMLGSDGHRGWLYYLAVTPGERRRGLGRRMVEAAERRLAGSGVDKVMLMIRPQNAEVAAFYRALGYAVEDRVLMARRFDPPPARG